MYQEEKTFTLRFSLEASFPDDYEGEEDNQAWVREWEARIKPDLLKVLFESSRQHRTWQARIRNRGNPPRTKLKSFLHGIFPNRKDSVYCHDIPSPRSLPPHPLLSAAMRFLCLLP